MIVIVDYGAGNLRSVQKALERVGAMAVVSDDPAVLARPTTRGLVLPGVGAFGDGMANLRARGLVEPLRSAVRRGVPLLGICLGMQLLFDESEEMGHHAGLGLLPGRVVRFPDGALRVPHIGWNQLHKKEAEHRLLAGIAEGAYAYFVHSFLVVPDEPADVLATTDYGLAFASLVGRGRIWGAQFHPEKSQEVGLRLLANYGRIVDDDPISGH
jgi:glutamine amidotransferase